MIELSQDNLAELIAENQTVFVQYSAGWCGNCRIMKPKFKRESMSHTDAVFVVIDAEKFPNSRALANVDNLPTFAAFKEGELVKQIQTNKYDNLKEFINEVAAN